MNIELKEAIEKCKKYTQDSLDIWAIPSSYECEELRIAIDTVLNRLENLENRYLKLIINGKSFKIKNDVKKLQYIDFKDNEFTLEVLEKWN